MAQAIFSTVPIIRNNTLDRPLIFTPTVVRSLTSEQPGSTNVFIRTNLASVASTSLGLTSSFRYDLPGTGLKSTQQINVNWGDFTNHTFFNSAQVKTNVAFEKVVNGYPFDGTQKELELFVDKLTGFEKYVYDQFPKNTGFLVFSGTNGESTGGAYVTVRDLAGASYPDITRNPNGSTVLNPGASSSMTLETHVYIPTLSSSNQCIFQKMSGSSQGFSFNVLSTGSLTTARLSFDIISGSYIMTSSFDVLKGQFNHVAHIWDRSPGVNRIYTYLNQNLVASSSQQEIGSLLFDAASLIIGSGSSYTGFTPANTLSGALDELRIWHKIRSADERKQFEKKNVFSEDGLKLYYRFNEPSGSNTTLVLDHGGFGLHGTLSSLTYRNLNTGSLVGSSSMTYEKLTNNPVLFPDHPGVVTLSDTLMLSASAYDAINPNLITRLIPGHYLVDGQTRDGFVEEEGDIINDITYDGENPGSARLGNTQALLLLLYTWAKYFDELKLYIDSFGNLYQVDYNQNDTIPDQFLQTLAAKFGIELPPMFVGSSIEQFINAENIDSIFSNSTNSLQYIQNQIWRRILINLRDVLDSKGTIHSIKSFIRSTGIDPDNNFRIREYGGPNKGSLTFAREKRNEASTMIDFVSGGLIQSPYLSASRTEPGYPTTIGSGHDGLFTSGSWTVEGIFKFENPQIARQSIIRLNTTGSAATAQQLAVNLVVSSSGAAFYVHSNRSVATVMSMSFANNSLMDGNLWNFCFGRFRGDNIDSGVSSSYFLRLARQSYGDIVDYQVSSSFFNDDQSDSTANIFTNTGSLYNASGSLFVVGSQSLSYPLTEPSTIAETRFDGKLSQVRFWSKGLTEEEWKEHVRNFKSLGVKDPGTKFNFVTSITGSYEKLRIDMSSDQPVTSSDTPGNIVFHDFSQNNLHVSGTGFVANYDVVVPQLYYYSYLSPHFDSSATTDKVRVRSFQNMSNILNNENAYAVSAPLYDIERSEQPTDNTRFSIDFSIADALNQDIINIFATLDDLDNALGNPELMFSPDYPRLEVLRDIYFNRLTDKINLKTFFEFYKWFDQSIGMFISQLVPRKTKYLGLNFMVESSMLERPKFEYLFSDMYLGDNVRSSQRDTITLQLFNQTLKKL